MKIHPAQQGSLGWMMARAGIVTASELDNLLTPEWKVRTGETPKTYLNQKIAEKWLGGPLPGMGTWDMDQGNILEGEAVPWFEFDHNVKVQRVGLCTRDDGSFGASPDGLIADDGGIEVKCPAAHTHVGYLMAGIVPKQYLAQVHGAMYATGRAWWYFLSYRRGFPSLLVRVERDERVQEAIGQCVTAFNLALMAGYIKLVELNGGEPKRTALHTNQEPQPNNSDVVP